MSAEFQARKYLGQLYDDHLQDWNDIFEGEADIDGVHFYLKIEKSSLPRPTVEMNIYGPQLIYRYSYRGDLTKLFDLAMLDPIGPVSYDD